MLKKIRLFFFFTVLTMALTFGGCYRTPEQRADRIVNNIVEKLNLNETQKAKLNAIRAEFLEKSPVMQKTRQESFDAAIALMRSANVDQNRLNEVIEKNRNQADEFIKFISAKFVEFHDMLTPEQREKAAREMEHWREQSREHSAEGQKRP